MKKSTIKEKIGGTMAAVGIVGIIAGASALEQSVTAMLLAVLPFFLIGAIGVVLVNETAEAEAPAANTMKCGKSATHEHDTKIG